jgi:hypothetical protein
LITRYPLSAISDIHYLLSTICYPVFYPPPSLFDVPIYFPNYVIAIKTDLKRLTTILFAALLILNVLGYYGVFVGLQYQNERDQIQRFDAARYNESETFIIKVPISIPYAVNQTDFERVDGEFEHQGQVYRMVKQKLSNDTLHIVCIKDQQQTQISQALKDYVKSFTDKPSQSKSNDKTTVSFIKDYIFASYGIGHGSDGWSTMISLQSQSENLTPSFFASIVHPPERA